MNLEYKSCKLVDLDYFLNSGLFVFKRNDSYTLEETMNILAKQFKLNSNISNYNDDFSYIKVVR